VPGTKTQILAERISHERELRAAERAAFDHERELRTLFDQHERELREKSEQAVEQARTIQFNEYERRLNDLNHAHELERERNAASVTRIEYDTFVKEARLREDSLNKALTEKFTAAHDALAAKQADDIARLNTVGTEGFRETNAERVGREAATSQIVQTTRENVQQTGMNRRWLIALVVTVGLALLGNLVTITLFILHIVTGGI
jgi:hypothetical protein